MESLMNITRRLRGMTRVTLFETDRMLVLKEGRFDAILGPGTHWMPRKNVLTERFTLDQPLFSSTFADALLRDRPDLADPHLTVVETSVDEMAVISRRGVVTLVLPPMTRKILWTDAGPWDVERAAIDVVPRVTGPMGNWLRRSGQTLNVDSFSVPQGHVGALSVDGEMAGLLDPGPHAFWKAGGKVAVRLIDTRWTTFEVTGHEILTRDRVTVRVNLVAEIRVVDPERAVSAVSDFGEALRHALALTFRKAIGATTLDALLAEKVTVGAEAAEGVRSEMAGIGLELREIALKDVILPGEMREILNRVVEAEKEAEANVIRRREETNATRSLLNTAKVMADNPVMLRLKELEALESIAGKVARLTVHNGTEGLMSDLVKLRD